MCGGEDKETEINISSKEKEDVNIEKPTENNQNNYNEDNKASQGDYKPSETEDIKNPPIEIPKEIDNPQIKSSNGLIHHPPGDFVNKEKVEAIISKAPDRTHCSLSELCTFFKTNTSRLCEEEKAWLVYRWMGLNIDYDVEGLHSGANVDVTPEGTFRNGKSVCSGYSRLYQVISQELGIETECISGYAKGAGYNPEITFTEANHEWNAVKLHDTWYLLDSTWGAGSELNGVYNRKYSQFYFCPDPSKFIRCHFPQDPKWQLLSQSVSKNKFESLLKYQGIFYDYGLISTDPDTAILNASESGAFDLKYDPKFNVKVSGSLYYLNGNTWTGINDGIFIQDLSGKCKIKVLFNKRGKYKASVFAKIGDEKEYSSVFEYIINCDTNANDPKSFPMVFNDYVNTGAVIVQPTMGPLKIGVTIGFIIKVEGVDEVMVVGKDQVTLTKNGSEFSGNVVIGSSDVVIYYKNGGSQEYSGLARYTVSG